MKIRVLSVLVPALLSFAAPGTAPGATLEVGPGKPFTRIEDANARAQPGDVVLVYPLAGNAPYEKVAVYVRHGNLAFRAVTNEAAPRVVVSGKGFDFSGRGSTPRAIFQFNKGADHGSLEGFELVEAHNATHNGAGVRINQANHVTVRNCDIHHNDMGIMSNGDGTQGTAVNQVIEHCRIHENGSEEDPGRNHNLYLGGTSVTVRFCEIHHSLTGHNLKSRAHYTRLLYSYVHDSANRELDLVDGVDTEREGSHAVVAGNIIVKAAACAGNRTVIHFGQDGGREHDGTLFMVHNTIITPFIAPVVDLSSGKARALLSGNFVCDGGVVQSGQTVASGRSPGNPTNVSGSHNWFGRNFAPQEETSLSAAENRFGEPIAAPFVDRDAHDFRPAVPFGKAGGANRITYPPCPGAADERDILPAWEYVHQAGAKKREVVARPTLGAHEPLSEHPSY